MKTASFDLFFRDNDDDLLESEIQENQDFMAQEENELIDVYTSIYNKIKKKTDDYHYKCFLNRMNLKNFLDFIDGSWKSNIEYLITDKDTQRFLDVHTEIYHIVAGMLLYYGINEELLFFAYSMSSPCSCGDFKCVEML
jgi:hypothetical protein